MIGPWTGVWNPNRLANGERESLGWREGLYFLLLLLLVNITKWTCELYAGVVKPFLSDLL